MALEEAASEVDPDAKDRFPKPGDSARHGVSGEEDVAQAERTRETAVEGSLQRWVTAMIEDFVMR